MDSGTVMGWLHRSARIALDAVLPPQCLSCAAAVESSGTLCAACWGRIVWLGPPHCARCGAPFDFDPGPPGGDALLCGVCLHTPPQFARARAVFRYDDTSRGLVLAFKHADRLHGAPAFGRWLARVGAELLSDADIVAPVPLHWTRLAWRRYNQAAVLALATASACGVGCVPDLLLRTRRTPSQGDLGPAARERNVRRAFRLAHRHRGRIDGRRVVLVDDVYTTGATVNECARVLLAGGAAAVDILTLARVVRATVA